jgi:thioredoxin-like negative regulator of GroEL
MLRTAASWTCRLSRQTVRQICGEVVATALCRRAARRQSGAATALAAARLQRQIIGCVMALVLLSAPAAHAETVNDLFMQLRGEDDAARAEAASKLAQIGGARVQERFRKMVASSSPEQRQMGVVGLLQTSDADADVELVRARLKDDVSLVRWSAAWALGQSGWQEAVPWLEDIANTNAEESVRDAAVDGLKKLRGGILWLRSLPAALKEANDSGKRVLAYFYTSGSETCQKFEEGVLADTEVVGSAGAFVSVRVNAAAQTDVAAKFDVRGAPTVLVLDKQGGELARVSGLAEKATLLTRLVDGLSNKMTLREAQQLAAKNPADVEANWRVAQACLDSGREELADPYLRNVVGHDEENRYGHTADAMFALGFCLGHRGKYGGSAYCMEHLLARWPDFKDKDKALYCLGLSQLATGQRDEGRATLERLTQECPQSSTIGAARLALEKLKTKDKDSDKDN